MGTKVKKGFMKPIRYISQMFDNKEPEMQIGYPTEVKHVAHIGWDGPNTNAPTWMNEYHSAPLSTLGSEERESSTGNSWGSQEFARTGGMEDSVPPPSSKPRHSRRHQSDGNLPTDTGNSDSASADGSRKSRKPRKNKEPAAAGGGSSDVPAIPKKSNRRKSKDSGGSVRSSTSKAAAPDTATEESNTKPSAAAADPRAEEEYI